MDLEFFIFILIQFYQEKKEQLRNMIQRKQCAWIEFLFGMDKLCTMIIVVHGHLYPQNVHLVHFRVLIVDLVQQDQDSCLDVIVLD